eukprot:6188498-Pleurochrysis_carterae.AAC.2
MCEQDEGQRVAKKRKRAERVRFAGAVRLGAQSAVFSARAGFSQLTKLNAWNKRCGAASS